MGLYLKVKIFLKTPGQYFRYKSKYLRAFYSIFSKIFHIRTFYLRSIKNNYSINKELLSVKLGNINSIINEFIYNINNNLSLVKSNITNGLFELYSVGSILGLNIDKLFEQVFPITTNLTNSINDSDFCFIYLINSIVAQ